MQQGFIDEDIKLPLPLDFPSKTIFWKRENKIFGVCVCPLLSGRFFFVLEARGGRIGWIAGHLRESNCFRVQTGVTRLTSTTVAFLKKK